MLPTAPGTALGTGPAHVLVGGLTQQTRRLSLAHRFRLASVFVLACGMFAVGWWVGRQIEDGVTRGTAETTALYMESFVAPRIQELGDGQPLTAEHVAALDSLLHETPLGTQIVAFKVWGPGGRLIYSADPTAIGSVFPVEGGQARAWQGSVSSEMSNLSQQENVLERGRFRRLLETYAPVRRSADNGQIIAVAEFYQTVDQLQDEIAGAKVRSWLVVGAAAVVMYVLLVGFVQRASDTIARQVRWNQALHERVRRAAARTAALNERFLRRISAELHDGPAQDLALALLRLDQALPAAPAAATAAARPGATAPALETPPPPSPHLETSLDALRRALQEVRAISAGLTLPHLDSLSLGETAARAVRAHEQRTGTHVAVSQEQVPADAAPAVKITLYRLLQEALNNAYRHAGGAGQRVHLRGEGDSLRVVVADRGPGFAPDFAAGLPDGASIGEEHLGLVGMRERVESLGGDFHVESAPGSGTTVVARLPLRTPDTPDTPGPDHAL